MTSLMCSLVNFSTVMSSYDPFKELKEMSFKVSLGAIKKVMDYMYRITTGSGIPNTTAEKKAVFREFVEVCAFCDTWPHNVLEVTSAVSISVLNSLWNTTTDFSRGWLLQISLLRPYFIIGFAKLKCLS